MLLPSCDNGTSSTTNPFDGTWKVTFAGDSTDVIQLNIGSNGAFFADWGLGTTIRGTVDQSGRITDGHAYPQGADGSSLGDFNGSFTGNTGNGTWTYTFGKDTWTATKL